MKGVFILSHGALRKENQFLRREHTDHKKTQRYIDHTEPYIMDIIKREQDFNVSLDYLSENEFFDDEKRMHILQGI